MRADGSQHAACAAADQDPESKYEALEKYARDLTQAARDGKLDPVIGRDDEVRRCVQILSRRTKNNPVLIGEPGVGKTAVAEALAQRIVAGDVPAALEGRTLMSLDMGALIAGAPSAQLLHLARLPEASTARSLEQSLMPCPHT